METASSKGDRVKLSPQATIDLMADLPIAPSFSEDLKKIAIESKSTLISVHARLKNLIIVPFAEICWYFSDSWEHSGSMEELKLSMGPIPIRKSFRLQVLLPFQQRKKDHLSVHGITLL
ncbi:hypothetical protein OIU78_011529 [Salix suchowensis]|nr:hypothetical protein OIU78_011529 [Salix suchowensis]